MFYVVLETVWFFVPAMVANMAPVFFARYKVFDSLNVPIDRGFKFRGRPLFGSHKTVRGFVVGVLFGLLAAMLQYLLYKYELVQEISITNYSSVGFSLALGFLLGFGALGGDALKSFFKRQFNIMSGQSWPVFDQIDFVVGATLAASLLVDLSYVHVITAIIVLGISSFIVSLIGVLTRLKNKI